MIGITAYGAYIPRRRLQRKSIAQANAWFAPNLVGGAKGERAMANWDEDAVTMSYEAGRDCLPATDPVKDRVYDAIGMVPTRSSIHFQWFLHSLNIQSFVKGPGARVREMLAARPAAVFIPSYRTDWLPEADHDFIRQHYVSLADDFWVLGKVLPPGGGSFEVIHPGRYRIASLQGSDLWGTYPDSWAGVLCKPGEGDITGLLDGVPLSNQPVELSVGTHQLETASGCQPACFWVGPNCDRLPRIGRGDHQRLFSNWY